MSACPVRGRGGRSETPTTSPNHCARGHSRENQPIRREQGPRGRRGGAMPHRERWLYLSHMTRPVRGGRRGRPNNEKYEGRRPKRDHSFRRCRPYRTVFSGDSAIQESRTTGATTSPITRDCNRPIDEVKGLPDRAKC